MSNPDSWTMALFEKKMRWPTTVGLQAGLGILFMVAPTMTLDFLEIATTPSLIILFQCYGALLCHRAVMEQFVRIRKEAWLCRAYMISTFPFSIGSSIFLAVGCVQGMMNVWIGWFWVFLFVAELFEYAAALVRGVWLRRRQAATDALPMRQGA